ncbi:9952_t:CDS:2, partial [Acaulospora colombiana]
AQTPDTSKLNIQQLLWIHFHRFSMFLEVKAIQSLSAEIKKHLQHLNGQLTDLLSKVEGEKTAHDLFDYIKAEKHIDFCSDEENESDILLLLDKVVNSWASSLKTLTKETGVRIEELSR